MKTKSYSFVALADGKANDLRAALRDEMTARWADKFGQKLTARVSN